MNQIIKGVAFGIVWLLIVGAACAEEKSQESGPWEKYALNFGGFISSTNTAFRLGSGAGIDIDVEKLLDLERTNTVFRLDGLWRFSENRKHRMDLSWFSLHRSGQNTIGQDITIPGDEGEDDIDIPVGTKVKSYFDLDIYQLSYSYSFFQDDRIDAAAQGGLYIMPIKFGLNATGLIDAQGEAKFTAPLPTFGLRIDIALTPKWFLRSGTDIFYLEFEQFKGAILSGQSALEYVPWKHVGIGLGVDTLRIRAEAKGEDYPGIDFNGMAEFSYIGLQLYARVFF